ncbi:synaptobrevin-domain-containing protein [Obelidium mucronatum]|nr:synaptobrevin-domain-containing protein [Obelidium mucronatum]
MSKTAQVQAQVNETIGVMQDNIHKVMQRGEAIETLNERSENLASSAETFKTKSKDVRMKMFWQDTKTRLMLGGIALVVIGLIIGITVWATGVHNVGNNGEKLGSPAPK